MLAPPADPDTPSTVTTTQLVLGLGVVPPDGDAGFGEHPLVGVTALAISRLVKVSLLASLTTLASKVQMANLTLI